MPTSPRQITAHTLTALKGWLPGNMGSIDFAAKLSANVTISPLYAGRVVSLNSVGEFETGCAAGATSKVNMPMFLWQDSDAKDVINYGGGNAAGAWQSVTPSGNMTGLVAIGGLELESTEFEDLTYAPGDCLKGVVANTDATTGGRITKGTRGTDMICGTCSRVKYNNAHGKSCISFWPLCLPPL